MKKILTILFVLASIVGYSQGYLPTKHIPINDAIFPSQNAPFNGRLMYYDTINFRYRDFRDTTEVRLNRPTSASRFGHEFMAVHQGGTLNGNGTYTGGITTLWWYRNGVADSNLVKVYVDSTNVPLSLVDTIYRVNDSVFNFHQLNGTTTSVLLRGTSGGGISSLVFTVPSGVFNSPVTFNNSGGAWTGTMNLANQSANTFFAGPSIGSPGTPSFRTLVTADLPTGIPNGNLANSSINFSIGTSGSAPNWGATSANLGGTAVLNIPTVSASASGIANPTLFNTWNNKVDSTTISNDSVYEFRNGTRYFRYIIVGGGGGGISSLNGLTTSTQTFANGASGTTPAFVSSGSTHTLNIPLASSSSVTSGTISNSDYNTFNAKQAAIVFTTTGVSGAATFSSPNLNIPNYGGDTVNSITGLTTLYQNSLKQNQLNGTGFVKASGTTISYDNSTYLTANQTITFTPNAGGDVTGTASGATSLTPNLIIGNNKVTYGKFQQASAGSVLLGAQSAGNYQEITLGTGLSMTAGVLNAASGGATNSNVGAGYRWALPNTNNIKTFTVGSLLALDSATTNQLNLKIANGTAGNIIGYDGSGNPASLAPDTLFVKNRVSGTGVQIGNISSDTLYLNNLVAGTNITITHNPDSSITISAAGGASGITSLNGLTGATQTFATGTTGTDFGISSTGTVHTFNLPTADPTHSGKLSSTDWSTFNNKLTSNLSATHIFMGNGFNKAQDTTLIQDQPSNGILPRPLSETKILVFANGVNAGSSVTNYSYTSIDSVVYRFSTTRAGTVGSTEYGGWLTSTLTGDSVYITLPFGVVIGDSQAEGHPALHGPEHWLLSGVPQNTYKYDYPDSPGTLSYRLSQITNYTWRNRGIGGQTTNDIRKRFLRDAFGEVSNPNDARGSQTLSRRPVCVMIIAGINDVPANITPDQTLLNLEWMASQCQQRGVKCVVFNLPGDALSNQAMLKQVKYVNGKLRLGILDQYGASVVDYEGWWGDSTYRTDAGFDNIHHNALIADDIHPTKTGYDSLAYFAFRQANLPVLRKLIFINELDPAGFTGYSRPASITIGGVSGYTISKSTDTLNVIAPLPFDSVWIKINSVTNVTGSSFTGFSSIMSYLDNNPNNNIYYTKRSNYNGSTKAQQDIATLLVTAPDFNAGRIVGQFRYADTTNLLKMVAGASGGMVIGGYDTLNGNMVVNSAAGTSPIKTTATSIGSFFGSLQAGNTSAASALGYGIGVVSNTLRLDATYSTANTPGVFLGQYYTTGINQIGSNGRSPGTRIKFDVNNLTGTLDTVTTLDLTPTFNNTSVNQRGNRLGGIDYNPTITSQGGAELLGLRNKYGNNYFNTAGGRTLIGGDSSNNWNALVEMRSTTRGFLPPRMTTAQRDSMGCVSSITITGGSWSAAPTLTLSTPGIGTGAVVNCYLAGGSSIGADVVEGGVNYVPGTPVTGTLTGGTGSGSTVTVNVSGPKNGMLIYNSTVDSLQLKTPSGWIDLGGTGGSNIFNSDGTLTANRTLSGGSFNLLLGTSGSPIGSLTGRANNITLWPIVGQNGFLKMFGTVGYGNGATTTDANYTTSDSRDFYLGGNITATRTVTIPSPSATNVSGVDLGIYIQNATASTNKWTPSSAFYISPYDSITSLATGGAYNITSDGTRWNLKSASPGIGLVLEGSTSITLATATDYVFNGSTATYTLPSLNANQGRKYFIKNAGSGNLTISRSGSDNIYDTSSVTSLTVAAGSSVIIVAGPSFWYKEN